MAMDAPGSATRRRSGRRRTRRFAATILQREGTRYVLAGIVGALALVFGAVTFDDFGDDQEMMGLLPLGINKSETHYGYGVPKMVRNGPSEQWLPTGPKVPFNNFSSWRYVLPTGGVMDVDYGSDGRVAQLSCGGELVRAACPTLQAVGLGDYEDAVYAQLGGPTSVTFEGPIKTMHYSEIGLDLTLREFRVERMAIHPRSGSTFSRLIRYVRWAIP